MEHAWEVRFFLSGNRAFSREETIKKDQNKLPAIQLYRADKKVSPIQINRPSVSRAELESVLDCLINDQLGAGAIVQRFERSFAGTFDTRHALAVNSLAAAYHLAFLALDIRPGDRVLMSALSPVQACDAVRYTGAVPLLLDIERDSFFPSKERIEEALAGEEFEDETNIFFVLDHTFGAPSPLDGEFFRERKIQIVEDFTGLVGSEMNGEYFGRTGQVSVCGLAEDDLLTTGNGAMLVTSDPKRQAKMQSLRYGSKRSENSIAYDYRMEDFRAALGLGQLSRLGLTLERRKKIGQKFLESLRGTGHEAYFRNPGVDAYLKFPVVVNKDQEEVFRYFKSLQIGVALCVGMPLHRIMGLSRMQFPNAERMYRRSVTVPVYPGLTANNVERIASSLRGLV